MQIKVLSKEEMEFIFKNYMPEAFPPKELKSLLHMRLLYDSGNYYCIGAYDGDELLCYAMLAVSPDKSCALLDYLASTKNVRNKGIGSFVVKELVSKKHLDCPILLEVDDPEFALDEKEKEIRTRRINFYLRNGCEMTDLKTYVYEADFKIMSINHSLNIDKVRDSIDKLYKTIFTKEVIKKHIVMKN